MALVVWMVVVTCSGGGVEEVVATELLQTDDRLQVEI